MVQIWRTKADWSGLDSYPDVLTEFLKEDVLGGLVRDVTSCIDKRDQRMLLLGHFFKMRQSSFKEGRHGFHGRYIREFNR